jgi:hypothetical protein
MIAQMTKQFPQKPVNGAASLASVPLKTQQQNISPTAKVLAKALVSTIDCQTIDLSQDTFQEFYVSSSPPL